MADPPSAAMPSFLDVVDTGVSSAGAALPVGEAVTLCEV